MAVRHNLCTNPALGNDVTGWGGGSTPTRFAVAGFGRPNAARYTAGTFLTSATGAVTPTLTYTVSAYVRSTNNSSGTIYIEWTNGTGGKSYTSTGYSLVAGTVTRVSISGTAAAGIVAAGLLLDGVNYALNTTDVTQVLVEQAAALDVYFDGDSAGATWDGTPGNSASTLSDTSLVSAADTGSGVDAASVVVLVSVADTGSAVDAISARSLTAADVVTGVDATPARTLTAADVLQAADAATVFNGQSADITVNVGQPRRGWSASAPVSGWSVSPSARRWSAGKPTI